MCEDDERNDTYRIPAEMLEKLRQQAAAEGLRLDQLLNEIVRDYLGRLEKDGNEN